MAIFAHEDGTHRSLQHAQVRKLVAWNLETRKRRKKTQTLRCGEKKTAGFHKTVKKTKQS